MFKKITPTDAVTAYVNGTILYYMGIFACVVIFIFVAFFHNWFSATTRYFELDHPVAAIKHTYYPYDSSYKCRAYQYTNSNKIFISTYKEEDIQKCIDTFLPHKDDWKDRRIATNSFFGWIIGAVVITVLIIIVWIAAFIVMRFFTMLLSLVFIKFFAYANIVAASIALLPALFTFICGFGLLTTPTMSSWVTEKNHISVGVEAVYIDANNDVYSRPLNQWDKIINKSILKKEGTIHDY